MRVSTSLITVYALVSPVLGHPHGHVEDRSFPSTWHHPSDHPVHALFIRDTTNSSLTPYSAAWAATYPTGPPDPSSMPQAWKDALAAGLASGKIPSFGPSTPDPTGQGGLPSYPANANQKSSGPGGYCVSSAGCRVPGDVWDAPTGVWGLGFDDGPLPTSDKLYTFLQQNNQHATHFFIGKNIIANLNEFKTAFETLKDDIAVHTWSHPQMTTLSNERVTAELGYTIMAIRDLTGGRLPKFWRPPYGDIDARVSAIARVVFGMDAIIWNNDPRDWALSDPGSTTVSAVSSAIAGYLAGPKSPGVIILEHELSDDSVACFIANYPVGIKAGWKAMPVSSQEVTNRTTYRNSMGDGSPVVDMSLVFAANQTNVSLPVSTTASMSSGSGTGSASQSKTSSEGASGTSRAATQSATSKSGSSKAGSTSGWLMGSTMMVMVIMLA